MDRGYQYDYMAYGPPPRHQRLPPYSASYGGAYSRYGPSLMDDLATAAILDDIQSGLMDDCAVALGGGYRGGWVPPTRGPMGRMPPAPRPARGRTQPGGVSKWGADLVNRQISKAQEKFLGPQSSNTASTRMQNGVTSTENQNNKTDDKKSEEIKNATPQVPIGPRISAKQKWETSYTETIKGEELNPRPVPVAAPKSEQVYTDHQQQAKKRKKRGGKDRWRRGPYFRRKKKKTEGESEGAAQEPGSGFDVDGEMVESVETATNADSAEFPKTCKVCNVLLNGPESAEAHYNGETHQKNINNFLSGSDEKKIEKKINQITENLPTPINTPECLTWEKDTGDRSQNTVRFCRLCSVKMSSLQNAKQHYAGKSHAKKIRIVQRGNRPYRKPFKATHFVSGGVLGIQESPVTPAYSYNPAAHLAFTQPESRPASSNINLKPSLPGDFANSMTPSGQYYCQTCNIVIEHAGSLSTHLQSKQHKLAKARS